MAKNREYITFGEAARHACRIFGTMAKSMKNMAGGGMMARSRLEDILKMSGPGIDEKGKLYLNQLFNRIKK